MTNLKIKLTSERRADIIDSVFNATLLPIQKLDLIAKTKAKVREIMRDLLPKDFEATIANLPPEWFPSCSSTGIRKDVNPETLLKDAEAYQRSYTVPSMCFDGFSKPEYLHDMSIEAYKKGVDGQPVQHCWENLLDKEITAAKKLRAKEDELRGKLRAVLNSVTTYKGLLEKMPELEKHLPPGPTKYYPVAVSVTPLVNLLDSVGFDQSVTE